MTSPVTPMSALNGVIVAPLFTPQTTNLGLDDDEARVMNWLSSRLIDPLTRWQLELSRLYFDGMNTVPSLGIAVPPELEPLRTVLGWCGTAVRARSNRLTLQGFRMPDQTTVDADLQQAWQWNNLDAESTLVHNDAMIYGRAFVVLGVGDDPDEPPLTTVESPLNMIASWDVRNREVSAAYQTYYDVDPASETFSRQLSTLYTRTDILQLVSGDKGWEVLDRNTHNLGFVPVIMFANAPTSVNRYGHSEIAPSWRNTQDRAARGLKRNEIAAEFFASMKVWILGTTEASFQKTDGTLATAWETFTGRISTLEADKFGNLPSIMFQQGQDPSGMIKFIDHERQVMSGNTDVPVEYFGMVSDGNPTSADAITKGDYPLYMCSKRLLTQFGNDWENWGRMALRIWRGSVPDSAEQLQSDWERPTIPTPNADAVTITTQIAAGAIPPRSDDALARMDWSPVERQRIQAEWKRQDGMNVLTQAIPGLKPPGQPGQPAQPMDGEQPQALNALKLQSDLNIDG